MPLLRFIILQIILAAALATLWLAGPLAQVFASESRWFVSGVVLLAGIGLVLSASGRQDGAARIQGMLPVMAVVAMQIGIIVALANMAQYLITAGDPAKAVAFFMDRVSTALYVSVAALMSYLWLTITLWLVHGE